MYYLNLYRDHPNPFWFDAQNLNSYSYLTPLDFFKPTLSSSHLQMDQQGRYHEWTQYMNGGFAEKDTGFFGPNFRKSFDFTHQASSSLPTEEEPSSPFGKEGAYNSASAGFFSEDATNNFGGTGFSDESRAYSRSPYSSRGSTTFFSPPPEASQSSRVQVHPWASGGSNSRLSAGMNVDVSLPLSCIVM